MKSRIIKVLGIVLSVAVLTSCYKFPEVTVTIDSAFSEVKQNSAKMEVSISVTDGGEVSQSGIIYDRKDSMLTLQPDTYNYTRLILMAEPKKVFFELNIKDLEDNGYYYCRPFAIVNGKPYYGETKLLVTDCPGMGRGPAGGYKFYDDGNGGGFEAAPYDINLINDNYTYNNGQSFPWGCDNIEIGGTSEDLGDGQSNTQHILSACSEEETAARLCNTYSFNGYDDWYLPSYEELELMYTNLQQNNYGKFFGNENFSSTAYATSSEVNSFLVKGIDFGQGPGSGLYEKYRGFYVRPIRNI